jgi:Na+/proline symporter
VTDPGVARPLIVTVAIAYFAVLAGIGAWAGLRTRDERDFFVAGQARGLVVTALATMASAFSGFVFVGGPGLMYRIGIASLWIVAPVGLTASLLCCLPARRLRRIAQARGVCTLPDALGERFASRPLTALTAVAIAAGSVAYLAAQLLALGVLLRVMFGFERLAPALLLGVAVLVGYSVAGGMLAGIWSELVQGTLMLAAALAVFVQALDATGGWRAMTGSIAASAAFGPGFLDPLGRIAPATAFGFFFLFGVGVLGQPHMLHKFMMLDDPRKLRFMPLALGGSQVLCLAVWLGVGLAVPALVAQGLEPPLAQPDDATPVFLLRHCPPLVAALAFAGTVAAIMSTADASLNLGAAALVRDLPRAAGRPLGPGLAPARLAVAALGLLATGLALAWGDLVALIGTFAFGLFAAALAPTMAVGLAWERVTPAAACASTASGLVLVPLLELWRRQSWFPGAGYPFAEDLPPAALALGASFLVLFAVVWAGELVGRGRRWHRRALSSLC